MSLTAVIFAWWVAHGAQPYQAAALVRHATVESGASPSPPRTGLGHCLYQWTGNRWRRLRSWAHSADCPSLEMQLRFSLAELRSPTYACFWSASPARAYPLLRRTFGAGAQCT